MKYRTKPIDIEAILWGGKDTTCLDDFCGLHWGRADAHDVPWHHDDKEQVVIYNHLERQWICCPVGHYIIRGMKGEIYPCDPDVFNRKYEPAQQHIGR